MRGRFAFFAGGRVLGSLLQAVVFLLFTRASSVSEVGAAGIVFGACLFLGTFADLGMMNLISRARVLGDRDVVAGGLSLNSVTTVVAVLVSCTGVFVWAPSTASTWALALLALSVAVEKNVETALAVPIADGVSALPALSIVLRRATALIAYLVLTAFSVGGLESYAIGALIGNVIGQVQVQGWLRRHLGHPRRYPLSGLIGVARRGTPFLLSNISGQARTLDTVALGILSVPYQAGLYAAATRLTAPLMLVPGTLTTILMPHAARSTSGAARVTARNITFTYLACIIPLLVVGVFAQPLIVFVLGERFAAAAVPFAISLASVPVVALAPALGAVLQGRGHERLVAINGGVFALILLVALSLGALFFGAVGVAASVALVYSIKSGALWLDAMRKLS